MKWDALIIIIMKVRRRVFLMEGEYVYILIVSI